MAAAGSPELKILVSEQTGIRGSVLEIATDVAGLILADAGDRCDLDRLRPGSTRSGSRNPDR
jgi:hypothetical protein